MKEKRPVILIHGLWNSSALFRNLINNLKQDDVQFFAPTLAHSFGRVSIRFLARDLNEYIIKNIGTNQKVDIVGFSMGGIIARVWLQQWSGASRVNNFISIGSPHNGTFTAQLMPLCLLTGVAEMKRGSKLLSELNTNISSLENIKCTSFFCRWDLMSFPGWQAVLPIGECYQMPVWTHKELITHPRALSILASKITNDFY